jgi:uncharacterized protein
MVIEIIIFIFVGCCAGFISGLLGIGGGLLVVPFLTYALPAWGVPNALLMHVAVATSLAIIIATSASSIIAHQYNGNILWPLFRRVVLATMLGALLGASVADWLSSGLLRVVFGIFAFFLSLTMFDVLHMKSHVNPPCLPDQWKLSLHAMLISGFCNLMGMGGGSILVPYLSRHGVAMRNAVGTAAVCGFPIAMVGTLGLALGGMDEHGLPNGMTGYVYWPAVIFMVIPSILCAPLGAKMTTRLSITHLRRIFALFLLFVSIDMLSKAVLHLLAVLL